MDRKKVLVTGAAGHIGTAFWRTHGARYDLRLADLRAFDNDAGCEFVELDITDAQPA